MSCKNKEFLRKELLPVLIPMQNKDVKVGKFEAINFGVAIDKFSEEFMINWIKEKFQISLGNTEGIDKKVSCK